MADWVRAWLSSSGFGGSIEQDRLANLYDQVRQATSNSSSTMVAVLPDPPGTHSSAVQRPTVNDQRQTDNDSVSGASSSRGYSDAALPDSMLCQLDSETAGSTATMAACCKPQLKHEERLTRDVVTSVASSLEPAVEAVVEPFSPEKARMPTAELMRALSDALDEFDSPLLPDKYRHSKQQPVASAPDALEPDASQLPSGLPDAQMQQLMVAEPDVLAPDADQLHSVVPDARVYQMPAVCQLPLATPPSLSDAAVLAAGMPSARDALANVRCDVGLEWYHQKMIIGGGTSGRRVLGGGSPSVLDGSELNGSLLIRGSRSMHVHTLSIVNSDDSTLDSSSLSCGTLHGRALVGGSPGDGSLLRGSCASRLWVRVRLETSNRGEYGTHTVTTLMNISNTKGWITSTGGFGDLNGTCPLNDESVNRQAIELCSTNLNNDGGLPLRAAHKAQIKSVVLSLLRRLLVKALSTLDLFLALNC